jgi:hypothetical protein
MRKIALDIESLAVETFETSSALAEARGTVQGADASTGCDSRITGACCDYTLALSCIVKNCIVLYPA